MPVICTIWYSRDEASISLNGCGCTLTSTLMTCSAMGTMKFSPSAMILFSTLPHQRTTPRWPAGTMTKVPHSTIRMVMSTMSIPASLGLGNLKSLSPNPKIIQAANA